MKELEIKSEQIYKMVASTMRNLTWDGTELIVLASDSYGEHKHRTWVFMTKDGDAAGTIERYWSGLKMISSVLDSSPRTSFFTEDGERTTNKALKGQ